MSSSMRIAELTEIGKIEYRESPVPHAGSGELLIRTRAVGLGGTDLKAFLRGHPYFKPPCILGHEFSGTIAEVGEGVEQYSVGEAVIAAPYVECGQCKLCLRDLGELCKQKAFVPGALQEFPEGFQRASRGRLDVSGGVWSPLAKKAVFRNSKILRCS